MFQVLFCSVESIIICEKTIIGFSGTAFPRIKSFSVTLCLCVSQLISLLQETGPFPFTFVSSPFSLGFAPCVVTLETWEVYKIYQDMNGN